MEQPLHREPRKAFEPRQADHVATELPGLYDGTTSHALPLPARSGCGTVADDIPHMQSTLRDDKMNATLRLHTAARRYCFDRHALWCERYSEIVRKGKDRQRDDYHYTDEALATFPRYNILNAIRIELERIDPATLDDLEAARELLILAGEVAEDDFTRRPISEIEQRAMAEEREAFCCRIRGLTASDLVEVEPLPFRRVLTSEESKSLWSRIKGRWQISEGYWYPLADCLLSDVAAYETEAFEEALPPERLHAILASHGIGRLWELREYGPEYEQDVSLFEPIYNGAEGYWSSGDLEWIVYASHEGSITVGGWLSQELKRAWPAWPAHVWTGSSN